MAIYYHTDPAGGWSEKGGIINWGDGNIMFASWRWAGIQFDDLDIPQGATITMAILTLPYDQGDGGTDIATLSAQDVDDGTRPISSVNPSTAPRTTAAATVPRLDINDEIDVSSVVQEIVNRPGWVSGNTINFISNLGGINYTGSHNLFDITLEIEFTAGGSTGRMFLVM